MSIQDDVIRLYKAGAKRIVLNDINDRPAIDAAAGISTFSTTDNSQLKSPLTEVSRTTQTVSVPVPENATSVDIEVITSLTMKDGRGYDYVFNFTPPA